MKTKARILHAKAEKARELEQDFPKAISLTEKAIDAYKKENDLVGAAEAHGSLVITYKHLFQLTKSKKYKILTKKASKDAIEVAIESRDKTALALPYFSAGDYYDTVEGNCVEAAKYYQIAIKHMQNNPPKTHNRPAVLMNIKAHLHACEYKNGDKKAIGKLVKVAQDIIDSNESKYEKDVWSSGAFMKAALLLNNENPADANKYMQKAKHIIDTNKDLVLRKKQWKRLNKSLK
ncbi:hypothetical protein ACFL2C_01120 [Patescibacteria group bacterium]